MLISKIISAVGIPLIAAGGFSNTKSIADVLASGAIAVS